jgi:hypothetical protein
MQTLKRSARLTLGLLTLAACTADKQNLTDPSFTITACPITITRGVTQVSHPHNTGPYTDAYWFLHNSSGSNVPITATGCIKDGSAVASCVGNNFGSYVPANGQIDGDVTYSTGPVGIGSVKLTVTLTGCGTLTAPLISVRST